MQHFVKIPRPFPTGLCDGDKATYMELREQAYPNESITFTYTQMAEVRGVSKRTIRNHLNALEDADLVRTDKQRGSQMVTVIFVDPNEQGGQKRTETHFQRSETGFHSQETHFQRSETGFHSSESPPLKAFKELRKDRRLESHADSLGEQDSESTTTDTTTADYIAIHDTAEHILPKWNERQLHKLTTAIVDAIEDANTDLTRAEAVHILRSNSPDIGNRKNPDSYIPYLLTCRNRIAANSLRLTRAHPIVSPSRFQALHAMINNATWTDEEKAELYSHIAWFLIMEDLDEEPALEILKIRACENYSSLDGYLSFWDKDLEGEARYGWVKELIVEGV
jgi:predicted ArsR family transcriptional regulator